MFQVVGATIDPNSREGASAYLMSIKIWDTDVIKEQWFYQDFTNQGINGGSITSKPQSIVLQYDQMYDDQYSGPKEKIVLASQSSA
jgi:hypothetical protein